MDNIMAITFGNLHTFITKQKTISNTNMREQQNEKLPKQLLTCTLCSLIFYKPITLPCGHTFCRDCMRNQVKSDPKNEGKESMKEQKYQEGHQSSIRKNLSTCPICSSIIWERLTAIKENLAIQNMVSNFYHKDLDKRHKTAETQMHNEQQPLINNGNSQYYNKILIKIKEPTILPSPCCISTVQFSTCFIDQIIGQAQQLVVTCESLEQKNLGLLCRVIKVDPIHANAIYDRVVFNTKQSEKALQLPYQAKILGLYFVKLQERELIGVDLRDKLIVLGQLGTDKIIKNLQICNCSIFHSKNSKNLQPLNFEMFFSFYDKINNPHYLNQIYELISQHPFQTRNNTELMMYCVLRVLKLTDHEYNKLILSFDDLERLTYVNNWLLEHNNKMIDQILRIKYGYFYDTVPTCVQFVPGLCLMEPDIVLLGELMEICG